MQYLQRTYPGAQWYGQREQPGDRNRGQPGPTTPALDVVWDALSTVPDPEIPVVSIVELGIVRNVAWNERRLQVDITPTYSGCPATEMIATLIRERLAAIGCTMST
jgi:ring-1,2-phenylacetyl-CoA epoxidase subunit PaaD